MHSTQDRAAHVLIWLMLLGGLVAMISGGMEMMAEGYGLRALWLIGGGLVLVLASGAWIAEARR
jgi:uncharacterized membrane protein YphA (DoxX/SURF4 family)